MLLGAAGTWILRPRALAVDTTTVTREFFEESLRAEGRTVARDRYTVVAFANGDLRRVTRRVGDEVKKGEPVARVLWDYEKEIPSPSDGVVSKIHRPSAGPIHRGDPILDIVDPSRLEAQIDLLTTDAVRVRPGMAVRLEGWGGAPLSARVVRISQAGFVKTSALGVEEERTSVFAGPEDPAAFAALGDNFHVDATIVLSTQPAALTVPWGALFQKGDDWRVFRTAGGRAVETPVRLGPSNDRAVCVEEGLSEGDRVILYPSDAVRDGARVSPGSRE